MDIDPKAALNAQIQAAMNRMWAQFLPQMHERVDVLVEAAEAVAAGTLSAEQKEQAQAAAHKLAGSLGTFGLTRGTEVAHELELIYARPDGPESESSAALAAQAQELRDTVNSRT